MFIGCSGGACSRMTRRHGVTPRALFSVSQEEVFVGVYLWIALSVLVWAVLFGTGIALWWSTSRPGAPRERNRISGYRGRSRHHAHL